MERNLKKLIFMISVLVFGIALRIFTEMVYGLIFDTYDLSSLTGILIRFIYVLVFIFVWLLITFRQEEPRSKLAWLLFLVVDPIIGMTFFLSFGRSFRTSLRSRKHALKKAGTYHDLKSTPLYPIEKGIYKYARPLQMASTQNELPLYKDNSRTKYIINGDDFFEELFEKVRQAKSHIFIEVYIFRYDTTGKKLIELLKEKAQAGVKVILIMDGLGSASFSFFKKSVFKNTPIEFYVNDPFIFPLFTTKVTYRNHRKLFIIDEVGYLGGMNIGDEYDNKVPYYTFFKDGMIRLEGAVLDALMAIFKKDYSYVTKKPLDFTFHPQEVNGHGFIQLVESGPDALSPDIHDLYLGLIARAEKSIKIMTPYLALDDEMMAALRLAIKEGVRVDIIIPGVPDKYLVYYITQYYMGSLINMGAHIYIYMPGFLHTKMMIIDDEIASLGSYNLDNRSARIDFEVTAIFIDDTVRDLVRDFEETQAVSLLENKTTFNKRSLIRRFLEHTLSLFSSLV